MIEWLNILERALVEEYEDRPRILTLATVAPDGTARARSVVCRRLDERDGSIWIASDARSEKHAQLRTNPSVECVLWLPRLRRQFRVRGSAILIAPAYDAVAREVWHSMGPQSRALFLWPAPGQPRAATADDAAFPRANTSDDLPAILEMIRVVPALVEELDLNPHPHRRRRWVVQSNWAVQELNP